MSQTASGQTLYGGIAETILQAIEGGSYREGDRIPSIRVQSRHFGVSLNTVKEAYSLLESQRYIEGRPQSGFFVRRRALPLTRSLDEGTESLDPTTMNICRIMGPLQEKREDPGLRLSMANLDPELVPEKRLNASLVDQARLWGARGLEYQFLPGDQGLREEIARWSPTAGVIVSPDDILITNGCTEAFHLALKATCKPGDTIAVESPTYGSFPLLAQEMDLRVIEIPSDPRDGLDWEILRFALDHHPIRALLLVANHNNPQGSVIPDDRKQALVELLESRGIPLIEDDVYGDLGFGQVRPRACKTFDRTGNVLYCNSFSKTLAPGWRVGWILPGRFKDRVVSIKSLMNLTTTSVTQKAVAAFLKEGGYDKHLRRLRARLAENMGALHETVARSFPLGTRTTRPQGGLSLWIELPSGTDSLDLYRRALHEGIGLSPGPAFSTSGRYGNYLRLCSGFWNPRIEAAVERLGRLAGNLQG